MKPPMLEPGRRLAPRPPPPPRPGSAPSWRRRPGPRGSSRPPRPRARAGRIRAPPSRWRRKRGRSRRGSPCATPRRERSPSPARAAGESGSQSMNGRPSCTPIVARPRKPSASWRRRNNAAWMSATSERSIVEDSPVYPLGSRVNERSHLEVGGCDVVEVAAEFGTPVYIYAEEDIRARARSLPRRLSLPYRRLRGPVREQGGPDHRDLPALRRGGAVGRRGLRRRAAHGAWRGPRPGSRLHAREQQDRGRASLRGRGRRRPSDRRLIRRDRPARRAPGSPPGRPDPRHPRDPALHSFLRADGWPRLEVRLRARGWPGGASDRRGALIPPPATGGPARPHRLPDLRAGALRGGDRGAGRARGRRLGVPHPQRRRRPGDRLYVGRSAALDRQLRRGQGRRRATGVRPGAANPDRAGALAGRQRRGDRLRGRHREGDSGRSDLSLRRWRDVRQPAADALRLALRGDRRQSGRRRAQHPGDRRRHALRVRRHPDHGRDARRPAARATSSSPPPPAPTGTRWRATTTASPAPRWCSARTGTRGWSSVERRTRI